MLMINGYIIKMEKGLKMANKLIYSDTIPHCMGKKCPLKFDCFHYWLHQELMKKFRFKKYYGPISGLYGEEEYNRETKKCDCFVSKIDIMYGKEV